MIDTINDPKILFPIAIPTISAMLFMLFWMFPKSIIEDNFEPNKLERFFTKLSILWLGLLLSAMVISIGFDIYSRQ
jgi:ABC-type sulfate transport system permease component